MKKILLFVLISPLLQASTDHSTPARIKKDFFPHSHYPPKGPVHDYPGRWTKRDTQERTVHKVILMPDPKKYWETRIKGEAEVINRLFKCYTVEVNHHPRMVDYTHTQYHFLS